MKVKTISSCVGIAMLTAATSSCAISGGSSGSSDSGSGGADSRTITLVTHDSWTPDAKVMKEFTRQTGYTIKVQKSGDVGALANKLALTKGQPAGDAVFGLDNTFGSRVTDSGALADYTSANAAPSAAEYALPKGQGREQLTPIDYGDACVNIDDAWFAKHNIPKPTSFEDLTKPQYKNLMAAPGASTSAPGLDFLLATIGHFGESGWKSYWGKLMQNGLKLDSGWDDMWNVDYTAGGGKGTRPIVYSYDTSTAATVDKAGKSTTSSLEGTCFRAVEYAGVLKGAKNPKGAKAFVDFISGRSFQTSLPDAMYSLPVDSRVTLPPLWARNVKIATKPYSMPPATVDAKRQNWLTQWQDVTSK